MKSVVVDTRPTTTGRAIAPLGRPFADTVIYEAHVARVHGRIPSSGVAPAGAARYAGLIERIPYLVEPRRHRGRAAAGLRSSTRRTRRRPARTTGATSRSRSSRRIAAYSSRPGAQRRRRRVPRHGQGAPPGRHRGHPRRRLQPHRRGRRGRPDVLLPRPRQRRVLHRSTARPRPLRRLQRHRQHAQRQPADRPAADPRQPPLLGRRRCTWTASASTSRRSCRATRTGRPVPEPPVLWDIETDPILAGTKLIAEAWDAGRPVPGRLVRRRPLGRVERPVPRRRAVVRQGRSRQGLGHRATRLLGEPRHLRPARPRARDRRSTSSPATTGSRSTTSVSYDRKHNEANGEGNRDGTDDNLSWNCGVEGPTDDPAIERAAQSPGRRTLLAIDLLAVGVPMLTMGDEVRRTQLGNNNAYCQDSELSWLDWAPRRSERRDPAVLPGAHREPPPGSRAVWRADRRDAGGAAPPVPGRLARNAARPARHERNVAIDRPRALGRAHRPAPDPERVLGGTRLRDPAARGRHGRLAADRRHVPRKSGRHPVRGRCAGGRGQRLSSGAAVRRRSPRPGRRPDPRRQHRDDDVERRADPGPSGRGWRTRDASRRSLDTASPWYQWGPYVSERAWGSVREDYSADGNALGVVPARPRALARVPLERGRHGRPVRRVRAAEPAASRCGTAATRSSRSGCSG